MLADGATNLFDARLAVCECCALFEFKLPLFKSAFTTEVETG